MEVVSLLYWVTLYLGVQVVLQTLVRVTTGVSFSYMNPFTFSISNLGWSKNSAKVRVMCRSVRFHFSIFGLCNELRHQIGNQYFFWIVDDIRIDVSKLELPGAAGSSEAERFDELETFDEFDLEKAISIYPGSTLTRFLVSWVLYLTPAVGIQINGLTLVCPNETEIRLSSLKAQTNINSSFERQRLLKRNVANDKFYQWLTTFNLDNLSLYNSTTNALLSTFCDITTISSDFKINLPSGVVKEMKNYIRVKGSDLSFLQLMKLMNGFQKFSTKLEDSPTTTHHIDPWSTSQRKRRLLGFGVFYKLVQSINISIQFFKISEFPVLSRTETINIINKKELGTFENVLFSSFTVDTITTTIEKLHPGSVGYNLKFVQGSFPLNWLFSLSSIKCSLDFSTFKNYSGKLKKFEILSIPSVMSTIDSTMLINLLRLVFNNDDEFDQRHTLVDLQCTITKLTLDISAEQLGIVLSSIGKLPQKSSKSVPTKSLYENWRERLSNVLFRTNPNWSYKLLLEKPTVIIKSENESMNKDIHIAYLSPSLLNFELEVIATSKSVEILSRLDIPNLALIYQRNNDNKNADNFFIIKDVNYKNKFSMSQDAAFYSWADISFIDLNLTRLSTLNGLREIVTNTLIQVLAAQQIIEYNRKLKEKVDNIGQGKAKRLPFFSDPPSWFKQTKIQFNDISLKVGSKSLLMTPDELIYEHELILPSMVEVKLDRFEFFVDNHLDEQTTASNSSSTQSELSISPSEYYYMATSLFENFVVRTETFNPDIKTVITEKLIELPLLNTKVYVTKENKFEIVNFCNTLSSMWSMSNNFTLFSMVYVLKNTVLKPFCEKTTKHNKLVQNSKASDNTFLEKFNIRSYIKEFQFKFKLSDDFHGRLDLFGIKVTAVKNPILFKARLLRLSVKKEASSKFYNRLLTFENLATKVKLPDDGKGMKILIDNSNVKISVPSNFIVHTLFESIKLSVKLTKRFAYILKTNDPKTVPPVKETKDLKLPTMRLKSKDLSFVLEDDPFEAELGSIFQLGLVEQESRLRKLKEFDKYLKDAKAQSDDTETVRLLETLYSTPSGLKKMESGNTTVDDYAHKLYKLRINLSQSWKHTVREFRLKKEKASKENFEFLTGTLCSKLPASAKFNSHIVDFNSDAPLMGILFQDIVITVSHPLFHKDNGDMRKFIQRVGKNYPEDTKWNQLVPMKVSLTSSEARVHLRDFPLPLVYIPGSEVFDASISHNPKTFVLTGDLVIVEMMPQSDKELWYRYVSVFSNAPRKKIEKYGCDIVTTICKTKALYELNCFIDSATPTMATWSNAYQPILRYLDRVFDGFSKPTRDPSLKLGVWDKMRDILHGSLKFKWVNPKGEVHIRVPNASDPYKIFSSSAGFSLSFKENVEWLINDPDRENERDYFIFKADKVNFGVPNYLATPLPSWNSNKLIFLPAKKGEFIMSSMFGYYLNTDLYYDPNDTEMNRILGITSNNSMKSSNIELDGHIELKLSLSFERTDKETGERVSTFKPHWENLMTNPDFINDVENYDAFTGFRSDYIHMALSLKTEGSSINSLRLTPRSFRQFFSWIKKFKAVSIPIRHGSLWNFKANSVKLGSHLMTFKFKFLVEPLYIYHGYRLDLINPENHSLVALKGKIGKFMCDLHERKEKKIKHVDFLDKEYSILSMGFYLGCVELQDIDLRAIGMSFDEQKPNQKGEPNHQFEIFDEDASWINLNDFNEIDLPKVNNLNLNGQILPLLHAKHFKYFMDSSSGDSDFGSEDSHECAIDLDNFPDLKFNHIFDIESLRFKWYRHVRNLVLDYISEVAFRDAYTYSKSYGSRKLIRERMNDKTADEDIIAADGLDTTVDNAHQEFKISDDPMKDLDNILHKITEKYKGLVAVDDMVIRLVDIQIQLMSNIDDENIILLHTPKNDIEIIRLNDKNLMKAVDQKPLAKRFGTVFNSANLYVISKSDFEGVELEIKSCYGSATSWPIFLTEESSKVLTAKNQIFSDICIMFFFEKVNATFVGARRDMLHLIIPSLKIKFTSLSYRTFFELTQKLLLYSAPAKKEFAETTEALLNSMDDQRANHLFEELENSIEQLDVLTFIQQSNDVVKVLDEKGAEVDGILSHKIGGVMTDIFLMVKSLILRTVVTDKNDKCKLEWYIAAQDLQVEFVDDTHNFLSFAIQNGSFTRLEAMDGSNSNEITIKKVDIFNDDVDILFPNLLTSLEVPESKCHGKKDTYSDMINVKWDLGSPIGGLYDVKLTEINCHPIKIALEDKTGIKLMKFLFPNHSADESESDSDSEYDINEEEDSDLLEENEDTLESSVVRSSEVPVPIPQIIEEGSSTSSISSQSTRESTKTKYHQKTPPTSNDVNSLNNKLIVSRKTRRGSSLRRSSFALSESKSRLKSRLSQSNMENMRDRAEKYLNIGKLKLNPFVLSITLFGTGKLRLMNVNDLIISIPMFKVTQKTWGYIDLIRSLKKHIIKTLLRHSGSLLKNKLFVYKRKKRLNKVQSK